MANVKFKLVNDAEQTSEAIEDRKLLYNYESKKIYVDSTTTRIEFYGFIGALSALTTVVKTSIVGAINELVTNMTKPKQAPTGTPVTVATSIVVGNVFTAPSNGVYQLSATFSTTSGYIIGSLSNGENFWLNTTIVLGLTSCVRIPVNTGQVITISNTSAISTVSLKFFPMV